MPGAITALLSFLFRTLSVIKSCAKAVPYLSEEMAGAMDVSNLVAQMHETLSTIHSTLAALSTTSHDAQLDSLERQRDSAIQALLAAFSTESEDPKPEAESRAH